MSLFLIILDLLFSRLKRKQSPCYLPVGCVVISIHFALGLTIGGGGGGGVKAVSYPIILDFKNLICSFKL